VAEMIFKRFFDVFEPESLMIAAMYTRRGGIDINPIRATHEFLIDETFPDMEKRLGKNQRQ
jgi:7-cyano-7-deazaguanine reductase